MLEEWQPSTGNWRAQSLSAKQSLLIFQIPFSVDLTSSKAKKYQTAEETISILSTITR